MGGVSLNNTPQHKITMTNKDPCGKTDVFVVLRWCPRTDTRPGPQWMPVAGKVEAKSAFTRQQGQELLWRHQVPSDLGRVLGLAVANAFAGLSCLPAFSSTWLESGRQRGAKQWRCHPARVPREHPSEDDLSPAVKEESGFVVSEHLAALHRKLRGCH